MKKRSIQCFNIVALFFISTVTCEAASDSTTTSQVVNTGTIASPVIVHQGKTNTLSSTGTAIGAATDTAGNVTASCPAGSVYRDFSFSDQRVYLYNPTGGQTCTDVWSVKYLDKQCLWWEESNAYRRGCYCPGQPNDCCGSVEGCNYQYPQAGWWPVCTPTGSGSWQSRSSLPSGSNTNAPSVFSGGTCAGVGWANTP